MSVSRTQIRQWLDHPAGIDVQATESLERSIRDFPYSGLLHMLYLKGLQNQESYLSTAQLKRTSMMVSNRRVLRDWMGVQQAGGLELEVKRDIVQKPRQAESPVGEAPFEKSDQQPAQPVYTEKKENPLSTEEAKARSIPDDLSHLPPRVREVIERSRSLQNKMDGEEPHRPEAGTEPQITHEEITPRHGVADKEVSRNVREAEDQQIADEVAAKAQQQPEPKPDEVRSKSRVDEQRDEEPGIELNLDEWQVEQLPESEPGQVESIPETGDIDDVVTLDFSAWLRMKQGAGDPGENVRTPNDGQDTWKVDVDPEPDSTDRAAKMELVDRFIEKQPRIKPKKFDEEQEAKPRIDVSAMGSEMGDDFSTETLAQVYKQQGYYDKALSAYEILRLKYPEKSSFFADQIAEIRRLQKKSQS